MSRRLAIVTPWFSGEGIGGSQLLARQLVDGLGSSFDCLDVLTTCASSFRDDWSKNRHREGVTTVGNLTVRRFGLQPRDIDRFRFANAFLLGRPIDWFRQHRASIPSEVSAAFCQENIQSPGLLRFLIDWGRSYDAIVFTPYLYGPILSGVELVADRAYLQPCLHDEGYAYLPQVERIFRVAKGLFFNSDGEFELAQRLYGKSIARKSTVVGHWVASPGRFRSKPVFGRRRSRYLLYLGRVDSEKNVDLLVRAFSDYRRNQGDASLELILAGASELPVPKRSGITALGAVNERQKQHLLASCDALVQPSRNESFSRAVMEAWSYGRPVAVHSDCVATAGALKACGAGWPARTQDEWSALFARIEGSSAEQLADLGDRGYRYYLEHGTPERTLARYRAILCPEPLCQNQKLHS